MTIAVATHLAPDSYAEELLADVRAGLTASPNSLPSKYCYDERGSILFDEITRLPEYYPTRTERAILVAHATEIAGLTGAETLVELGSGTSEKTRLLLDALHSGGTLRRFTPFDVDPTVLTEAGAAVAADYPALEVQAVVGDFERHLDLLPRDGRQLVAFLGSTIGNFDLDQRAVFLAAIRATLGPGDAFLLGTDLVKDPDRLVAAYDDAQGVTTAFNRNVLVVINRELGADFDLTAFEHVARWDAEREWIEMRLPSGPRWCGCRRCRPRSASPRGAAAHRDLDQIPARADRARAGGRGVVARAVVDRSGRGLRAVPVRPGLSTPFRALRS